MIKRRRSTRPLFLIDLGVPRNFAADLGNIDNVYLYNIDDLSNVATSNMELREAAAKDAEMVIEYGLAQFERWRRKISVQPELIDLRQAVERICAEGVAEALPTSLKGIGDNLAQEISYSISQKISHELTMLLERQKGINPGGTSDTEVSPFLLVPVVQKSEE